MLSVRAKHESSRMLLLDGSFRGAARIVRPRPLEAIS
jgi:hypothetical protein